MLKLFLGKSLNCKIYLKRRLHKTLTKVTALNTWSWPILRKDGTNCGEKGFHASHNAKLNLSEKKYFNTKNTFGIILHVCGYCMEKFSAKVEPHSSEFEGILL